MHRRLAASLLVLYAFLIAGCCDKKTKRIQPHWLRTTESYLLKIERIDQGRQPVLMTKRDVVDTSFEDRGFVGKIGAQHYGFWLEITNKGTQPVRLLWPNAQYIDEEGKSHEIYWQPRGVLPDDPSLLKVSPPTTLAPSEKIRPTIVPIYKQYMVVEGCDSYVPFSEPLVPTTLEGRSEAQMKAYVDDLARRQVPVKLVLPIEIDGIRYDYTFAFVLKDRAAPKE